MTATLRVDLHVHSRFSPDGRANLEAIVDQIGVAGLQGFALTDHNTLAGHRRLAELRTRFPMYWLLPGVEVSTVEGHLLVYGVSELPPIHAPLADTLDWVRSRGGVGVLAHPFRWSHGVGRHLAETSAVAAIETSNGHNSEVANARAELVAARRGLGHTGGSDAHDVREVGRAYTEFPNEFSSLDDLLEILRRGRTLGGGRSLTFGHRVRLGIRTGLLRAARGFRSI
jgi:predicted metal-dependent phosphoesterase TrpH